MYKKIILILLIIFLLITIVFNNKEHFYDVTNCSNCSSDLGSIPNPQVGTATCCNYHNIVYKSSGTPNNDFGYDTSDIFGPKCLNTCLVEHVAKLDFQKAVDDNEKNVIKLRRQDSSNGFCHNYNSKDNNINKCENDCLSRCSNDRHCKVENNVCVEKNLNYLSGGAVLNSTKCSNTSPEGCVNKYIPNIETIKQIYDNDVSLHNSESQCEE